MPAARRSGGGAAGRGCQRRGCPRTRPGLPDAAGRQPAVPAPSRAPCCRCGAFKVTDVKKAGQKSGRCPSETRVRPAAARCGLRSLPPKQLTATPTPLPAHGRPQKENSPEVSKGISNTGRISVILEVCVSATHLLPGDGVKPRANQTDSAVSMHIRLTGCPLGEMEFCFSR